MRKTLLALSIIALSTSTLANERYYIKANIGANKMRDAKEKHDNLSTKSTKSKSQISPTFGIGAGYYINDTIRTDLTFDYSKASFKKGQADFNMVDNNTGNTLVGQIALNRKADVYSVMINGYVDVLTADNFSIFLGAGIGGAQIREKLQATLTGAELSGNVVINTVNKKDNSSSKNKNNFAYSLTLGSAFKVSPVLNIDLSYSWRDYGSTSHKPDSDGDIATKNRYNGHIGTVGIRFNI